MTDEPTEQSLKQREEPPTVGRTLEVSRFALRQIYRSQLPRMAAALAYRTIFAIVPVLVIGLAILGAFASEERVESAVKAIFQYTGISEIEIGEEPTSPEVTVEAAAPSIARLESWISEIVDRVEQAPLITIGLTGLAALIYAAMSFLIEIERAFNQLFHAPTGRSWLRRLTQYWTLLTLGVLLLFATFYVGDQAAASLGALGGAASEFSRLIGFAISTLISTLVLLLMYKAVPNARVHLNPALAGAALAAIMWEFAKLGLEAYVVSLARGYTKVYGAIGLVPIFLLWIYLTWLIILFGLQVTYLLQTFRDATAAGFVEEQAFADPACALAVASAVARRFEDGQAARLDDVAQELGLPETLVERLLEGLLDAGIVHRVEAGEEESFTMARPPHAVDSGAVLRVGLDQARGALRDESVAKARRAQIEAFQGVPLRPQHAESSPPGEASPATA